MEVHGAWAVSLQSVAGRLAHALGTYAVDGETMERGFSTLIPRGHKLPAVASDVFVPIVRETKGLDIEVVEGDPHARNPDFTELKKWYVELPTEYDPNSIRQVNIEYRYDVDGILQVIVSDVDTGAILLDDDVSYGVAVDKQNLKPISDRAQQSVQSGLLGNENVVEVDDPESLKLITQARSKVLPFLDDSEAKEVEEVVTALANAEPSDVAKAREALATAMRPYSYLF